MFTLVPVNQHRRIRVSKSRVLLDDYITTTKPNQTKPNCMHVSWDTVCNTGAVFLCCFTLERYSLMIPVGIDIRANHFVKHVAIPIG